MATPAPTWEPVHERADGKGRIVYYRLVRPNGTYAGSAARKDDGWRALAYGPDGRKGRSHDGRKELGSHPSKRAAQRAVEDYEATRRDLTH